MILKEFNENTGTENCKHCGNDFPIKISEVAQQRIVTCPHCFKTVQLKDHDDEIKECIKIAASIDDILNKAFNK